jgi:uncharacterized protein
MKNIAAYNSFPCRDLNVEKIKNFAIKTLSSIGCHSWDHTLRVHKLCARIGKVEGADLEILEIASYLHDIGRPAQDESKGIICHAEEGARIAAEFLNEFEMDSRRKSNIIHSIRTHRFRGDNKPETLEARVLFDADKLDAIGAVGIGRAFQFAGEVGAKLHNPSIDLRDTQAYTEEDTGYREYRIKLSKIKARMLTEEGLRIAQDRHEFMALFFERFIKEYNGEL